MSCRKGELSDTTLDRDKQHSLILLRADFVAKVGNGKSEAVASMSLSGLLHPLHLAAGPLRQRH